MASRFTGLTKPPKTGAAWRGFDDGVLYTKQDSEIQENCRGEFAMDNGGLFGFGWQVVSPDGAALIRPTGTAYIAPCRRCSDGFESI
jgi:hypothetical protein